MDPKHGAMSKFFWNRGTQVFIRTHFHPQCKKNYLISKLKTTAGTGGLFLHRTTSLASARQFRSPTRVLVRVQHLNRMVGPQGIIFKDQSLLAIKFSGNFFFLSVKSQKQTFSNYKFSIGTMQNLHFEDSQWRWKMSVHRDCLKSSNLHISSLLSYMTNPYLRIALLQEQ